VHMQRFEALYAQHGKPSEAPTKPSKGKTGRIGSISLGCQLTWVLTSLFLLVSIGFLVRNHDLASISIGKPQAIIIIPHSETATPVLPLYTNNRANGRYPI